MRVGVDDEKCQGHARCYAMSKILTVDDDGYSDIGSALEVPHDEEDAVRRGVSVCPEKALVLRA